MRVSTEKGIISRLWRTAAFAGRRIEDVLSGIITFIVAVAVGLSSLIIAFERPPSGFLDGVSRYGLAASVCGMELLLIFSLFKCRHRRPYPPQVALAMPQFPLIIRPAVSLFWGTHLLLTAGFVWSANSVPSDTHPALRFAAFIGGSLCSFWAFSYLLLVVASLKRDRRLLRYIWRTRKWYLLLILSVALILPYTGFVLTVRDDVSLTAPARQVVLQEDGETRIRLGIKNTGSEAVKILKDASWADFTAEVRTPSGATFTWEQSPLLRSLPRSHEDYFTVPAGSSRPLYQLPVHPGQVLGTPSDWQQTDNANPSAARPFVESGVYQVKLTYRDRAGTQYDAVSILDPVLMILVIK